MFRSRISSAKRKSSSSPPMAARTSGNSGNGRRPSGTAGSASSSIETLTTLEAQLGHTFSDPSLLKLALSHASIGAVSNERLEFLGDRVLGLIVAERLYADYPDIDEGGWAVRLNALVRREACAKAGDAAGLSHHLIMAASESGSGGRKKGAILAGACGGNITPLFPIRGLQ